MDNLATVRADIKTWERSYRAEHGADPTVDDIKAHPHIADKYKLYKRLSKVAAASRDTPPPPHASKRLSRVQPTAPVNGFNPFSPTKKKPPTYGSVNPFATPAKGKEKRAPPPEEEPFPTIQPLTFLSHAADPGPSSPVTRARKRLRGEPVSPSPHKSAKRARTASEDALPFAFLPPQDDNEQSEGDEEGAGDTSFVDDSPVKPPAGDKAFRLLFDEATPALASGSAAKGKAKSGDSVFGSYESKPDLQRTQKGRIKKLHVNGRSFPKGDLSAAKPADPQSRKRTLSNDLDPHPTSNPNAQFPFLPPSPPPPDRASSSRNPNANGNGKGKGKAKEIQSQGRNKKAKVTVLDEGNEEDTSESGEEGKGVRVVNRTQARKDDGILGIAENKTDDDEDLTSRYSQHRLPSNHADGNMDRPASAIDLPAHLLTVLSLSANSIHRSKENHVVRRLLSGRGGPYDGGEIWGAGEDEGEGDEVEDEGKRSKEVGEDDEWEGEGVPWEVGEL